MIVEERVAQRRDQLLALLRRELSDRDLEFSEEPVPLTGGFWAELFVFALAAPPPGWVGRLVARIMPDAAIAAKEVAFQAEVARQGFATPGVRLFIEADRGLDGRAVMVMDLAMGAPPLGGLAGQAAVASFPKLVRRLPRLLGGVLAQLHGVDPAPVVAQLESQGLPTPGVDWLIEVFRIGSATAGSTSLQSALDWLHENRPKDGADVVCHGDMHPFNVLVDGDAATVVDWSAAVIAPRGYDLGFTSLLLGEPPLELSGFAKPLLRFLGGRLCGSFLRAYERESGVKTDAATLRWYQALICVRALTEVALWSSAGTLAEHAGHPWLINEVAFIRRLRRTTGVSVSRRGTPLV